MDSTSFTEWLANTNNAHRKVVARTKQEILDLREILGVYESFTKESDVFTRWIQSKISEKSASISDVLASADIYMEALDAYNATVGS